ncbi:hypothetical protein Tco_0656571 [Tanacetum coccineum]|uniref:Uncharacterized protein n=1 Tax=Tanacetum coccineum TaxID=301880 RepID=A0ABQ4X938_9ASTR
MVFHNEDGNPARANIKQALGYLKDGDGDGNSQFLRCQVNNQCSDTTYTCYEVMKDLIKVSKLPQTLISYISSQVHQMAINYKIMQDYVWAMISRKLKITVKDKSKMNQKISIPNVQDIKCLRAKD